jgi:hypothetical protein
VNIEQSAKFGSYQVCQVQGRDIVACRRDRTSDRFGNQM